MWMIDPIVCRRRHRALAFLCHLFLHYFFADKAERAFLGTPG